MVANNTPESNVPEVTTLPLTARLSTNISTRRRALGLTQAQLAERLGVDTETLSRFERGKHLPSVTTLERLALLLLTTVGELLAEKQQAADDDALAITSWLSSLADADRVFVRSLLKQCCDYLGQNRVV
jgi:transcriptional regulator with XRE-family HTH domain